MLTLLQVKVLFTILAIVVGRILAGMTLGSIDASQAGRKGVNREERLLGAASFEGTSKIWRRRQALEVVVSFVGGSKL